MPKIQSTQDSIAFCRNAIDHCSDAIINLQGEIPNDFKFAFTFNGRQILAFDVSEDEANFAVGIFMSWHQFFSRKLKVLMRESELENSL